MAEALNLFCVCLFTTVSFDKSFPDFNLLQHSDFCSCANSSSRIWMKFNASFWICVHRDFGFCLISDQIRSLASLLVCNSNFMEIHTCLLCAHFSLLFLFCSLQLFGRNKTTQKQFLWSLLIIFFAYTRPKVQWILIYERQIRIWIDEYYTIDVIGVGRWTMCL